MFVGCSWGVRGVFEGCSRVLGVLGCGVFVGCSWGVRGVFVGCSWGVRGVFESVGCSGVCEGVGCSWGVRGVFHMFVGKLFKSSRQAHGQRIDVCITRAEPKWHGEHIHRYAIW